MRIVAIVQARYSSARLPGKVLMPLAGRPMLGHLLARLRRVEGLAGLVVATSDGRSDDPVADFALGAGVGCFRGPLENVAARMLGAARMAGAEAFVRISGDSPLLDPGIVAAGIALWREAAPDLVTNVAHRTFPKGQSVEIIGVEAFSRLLPRFESDADREHVTPFLYRNPGLCRIAGYERRPPAGDVQLSVDTAADFAAAEHLFRVLGPDAEAADLDRLLTARQRLVDEGVIAP